MAIDLLKVIRDDVAIKTDKTDGFTGAIFLTYSLNLTFFEQILTPALDEAGCSNVLILVDPDGYQQALEMGAKSINGVGLRYVCVPIPQKGKGIQHAKMLFMVGPKNGRLLIGSGNLTFHGYGRNLELYSLFNYPSKDPFASQEPFHEAWDLIQKIVSVVEMPIAAQQQLDVIQEKVKWLKNTSENLEPNIWHNYDRSILEQLLKWRPKHGFVGPINSVQAISPYYDQHLAALKKIASGLSPAKLNIYLDPNLTNLDGKKAIKEWHTNTPEIEAFQIKAGEKQASHRHIHAKAIIGKEKKGSWIISGSANLSYPALLASWQSGGNLELITFFWSENPEEFDYLLDDEMVSVKSVNLSNIIVTENEPSEGKAITTSNVFLVDLYLHGDKIIGRLSSPLPDDSQGYILHLLRNNIDIPVQFQDSVNFEVKLKSPLKEETESAKLVSINYSTSYRWIDQPEVLARYGARSHQSNIKGKIETLPGAEKLFKDLMDFLWDRVDLGGDKDDQNPAFLRRQRRKRKNEESGAENNSLPPGAEAFITDEDLVENLKLGLEHHQPYNRSLYSLQDLFSIVLLRLTTPTGVAVVDQEKPDEETDEEADEKNQAEQKEEKIKALQRLRDYLIRYCKRYSDRLVDVEFLKKVSIKALFENHYTLGRILLEFSDKTKEDAVFSDEDLFECLWIIWAPLVWPEIINLNGISTLKILTTGFHDGRSQVLDIWRTTRLSSLIITMFVEVFGRPPSWSAGIGNDDSVEAFMIAREWIERIKIALGSDIFSIGIQYPLEEFGVRTIHDMFNQPKVSEEEVQLRRQIFSLIEEYRPPIEEKYSLLFELDKLIRTDPENVNQKKKLIAEIISQGLSKECANFLSNPKPIVPIKEIEEDNDDIYCPRCGAGMTEKLQNELLHGHMILCDASKDVWMYLRPDISRTSYSL
jgi:hypothetical protein